MTKLPYNHCRKCLFAVARRPASILDRDVHCLLCDECFYKFMTSPHYRMWLDYTWINQELAHKTILDWAGAEE